MNVVLNFVAFQIGWFSSVLGGANQMPWIGPLAVLFVVGTHLVVAERPAPEFVLVVLCGVFGTAFDSLLVASGWVTYPSGMFSSVMAPYWISAMWCSFATTLNLSMRWMKGRPILAAVTGLVAGPLTYIAGHKLGGIEFIDRTAALLALAIGWAIILPVLMHYAERFNGVRATRAVAPVLDQDTGEVGS